ncbi:hypothetical protein GPECTOR_23g152 [Gonium pectorale]|uniref:Protein kinase domain-containing protein n=1 Tax=Gonium pectorale TaxID=33097 RepID=A0A150GGY4_GONPE|nr:hypothetical protein GPECTOR_23g152 [Gonium pectorale]|eukprot:KXZ49067.1 hypothetical protein GPECTOR_23g152 [Gonium pectorale]
MNAGKQLERLNEMVAILWQENNQLDRLLGEPWNKEVLTPILVFLVVLALALAVLCLNALRRTTSNAQRGELQPDATDRYLREALPPAAASLMGCSTDPAELESFLAGPLGRKLPVLYPYATLAALQCADVLDYVTSADSAAAASHTGDLAVVATAALHGNPPRSTPCTPFLVHTVVGSPLALAARALGLDLNLRVTRNAPGAPGETARALRPDYLCWVDKVLVFKGEERASEDGLEEAIYALRYKMTNSWYYGTCHGGSVLGRHPELLPGVAMPGMLAYAAAGSVLQFFALIRSGAGGSTGLFPISARHDLCTALGRIRAFHATCNVARLLASDAARRASRASDAPTPSVALGSVLESMGAGGERLRAITFLDEYVQKRVFRFLERHADISDFGTLQALYGDPALAQCPNLARLHEPDAIRLEDGTTLVLHLVPVGVPQRGPPEDMAALKRAVRDVLIALAALHAAGFVHRDVRWANVVWVPGATSDAAGSFVLIDLEHAARSDCPRDCREPEFALTTWPPYGILDPADGAYTPASDLCLVAHCLLGGVRLDPVGSALRTALRTRQLSAEGALAHEWLAAVGA